MTQELAEKDFSIDCIKGQDPSSEWHSNSDYRIYISFNAEELHKTYQHFPQVQYLLKQYPPVVLRPEMKKEIKNFLRSQFEVGGVRFTEDRKDMRLDQKNVVFLLYKSPGIQDNMAANVTFPASENKFKIILMPAFATVELRKFEKYLLMHELMHAIAGSKHPVPRQPMDHPPYCPKVTCKDSVTVYMPQDCPEAIEKERSVLGPKKVRKDTNNPAERKILEEVFEPYPDALRPMDLELLRIRSAERKQNVLPVPQEQQVISGMRAELACFAMKAGGAMSRLADWCLDKLIKGISAVAHEAVTAGDFGPQKTVAEVVSACPSAVFNSTSLYLSAAVPACQPLALPRPPA